MEKRITLALCVSCFTVTLWAGQVPGPAVVPDSRSLDPRTLASLSMPIDRTPHPVHVVSAGDTLYDIARANNISLRELKRINHLQSNRLKVGQRLLIDSSGDSPGGTERKSNKGLRGAAKSKRNPSAPMAADRVEGFDPGNTPEIAIRSTDALLSGSPREETGEETEDSLRSQLVLAGLDFLGVPYRWRGMSERHGVDCSGLVKTLFDKFQIDLPHSAREQFKLGEKVARAELAVGDLVFFSTRGKIPTHVGIYIGDNRFIHAARKAGHVVVSNLSQSWYQRNFVGARRISDLWKDEPKPPEGKGN
ncbi:MAG: NlpC/P60 family protein [Terriglobia bacterium]